ncbi:MAG: hypothetical protein ACQEQV_09775 [Fibrobacterota bacterium]
MFRTLVRLFIICVLFLSAGTYAAEVCRVNYTGMPDVLQDTTLDVPGNAVAYSDTVAFSYPEDSTMDISTPPAVMFVIDNSGSMYRYHGSGLQTVPRDRMGNRFRVTRDMIDTLYEKNPQSRVGVTVFGTDLHYYQGDLNTDVFVEYEDGAYINFLQLDHEYEESAGNRMTGYDILMKYLQTDTVKHEYDEDADIPDGHEEYVTLTYKKWRAGEGTNITRAFNALRDALPDAGVDKSSQYTVFFSDGDATFPQDDIDEQVAFAEGTGIPTTFTIFFNPDLTAPDILKKMNTNVQTNGYSSSNPESDLWPFENTSYEDLLTFMSENVIEKLTGKVVTEAVEITVNGGTTVTATDGSFVLDSDIPLTGERTPLEFILGYNIEIDTIRSRGEIVYDTLDFALQREDAPNLIDGMDAQYWSRRISFESNGSTVLTMSDALEELDLVFRDDKVDLDYPYEDIELILSGDALNDTLICSLSEVSDSRSEGSFRLDYSQDKALDDDLLQVTGRAPIRAYFRNPALPLDTLTAVLESDVENRITLDSAAYFDRNADGAIDRIAVYQSSLSGLDQETADHIRDGISLPGYRNFTVQGDSFQNDTLFLDVKENRPERFTGVRRDEVISFDGYMDDSVLIENSDIEIIDKVAPVVQVDGALLQRRGSESRLMVTFTEPLKSVSGDTPFLFYNSTEDREYRITMEEVSVSADEHVFRSASNFDALAEGDSLRINWKYDALSDKSGNTQRSEDNIRREVKIVSTVYFSDAALFDIDADGFPDFLSMAVAGLEAPAGISAEIMADQITLPDHRGFTLQADQAVFNSGLLEIPLEEDENEINTAVDDRDILQVKEYSDEDITLSSAEISIADSMAPVIADSAVTMVKRPGRDPRLSVNFSEDVSHGDGNNGKYFIFYKTTGGTDLLPEMDIASFSAGHGEYALKEYADMLENGDSVHINFRSEYLGDSQGRYQLNRKNRKVPLRIQSYISVDEAVFFDADANGRPDELTLHIDGITGVPDDDVLAEIARAVTYVGPRSLTIQDSEVHWYDDVLTLSLNENEGPVRTDTERDSIHIGEESIGPWRTTETSLSVIDSMDPVIIPDGAVCTHPLMGDAPDTLEVTFSEEIHLDTGERFNLLRDERRSTMTVSELTLKGTTVRCILEDMAADPAWCIEGDSMNIRSKVFDLQDNEQRAWENSMRRIIVKNVLPDLSLVIKALNPFRIGESTAPDAVSAVYAETGTSVPEYGQVVAVFTDPDISSAAGSISMEGELQIFDQVGNLVLPAAEMVFSEDAGRLYFIWDGTNQAGRSVAEGSYLCLVTAKLIFPDGRSTSLEGTTSLGVQKVD